ncbi:hypothetical protein LCM17_04080 [Cereibacter sphaeroides]|nr:hypothetical protein [Cereibacter sphaeroides]
MVQPPLPQPRSQRRALQFLAGLVWLAGLVGGMAVATRWVEAVEMVLPGMAIATLGAALLAFRLLPGGAMIALIPVALLCTGTLDLPLRAWQRAQLPMASMDTIAEARTSDAYYLRLPGLDPLPDDALPYEHRYQYRDGNMTRYETRRMRLRLIPLQADTPAFLVCAEPGNRDQLDAVPLCLPEEPPLTDAILLWDGIDEVTPHPVFARSAAPETLQWNAGKRLALHVLFFWAVWALGVILYDRRKSARVD